MPKWDYMSIILEWKSTMWAGWVVVVQQGGGQSQQGKSMFEAMQLLGREGWELVESFQDPEPGKDPNPTPTPGNGKARQHLVFKRPLVE